MSDTPSLSVLVPDLAELLTQLRAEVDLAYRFESAARRESAALDVRVAELTAEVRALRSRVEPLERVARLADGLTVSLMGWNFDAGSHVGSMVRAIQAAIRELRPPTVPVAMPVVPLASRPAGVGGGAKESKES